MGEMPRGNPGDTFAPPPGADTSDADLLAGRYRLIRRLGSGGMARVDLAEDVHLQRQVAVKRLHSGRAEEDARRFAREAHLGATLNHPNVVTVFDAASDGDTVLLVMEYVPGTDLESMLGSGPLDEEEALRILDGLAAAIDHAHDEGIVHRDIKPSNVLIRNDATVKLADLGVARALEDTAITRSGLVLGSLPYIAPEALRGEEIGPEADVYSLALIAYEALTGRKARREGTLPEVTQQAVNEPPPDLRAARSDLPQAAADVVTRALDPNPSRRPASAGAFVRDLREGLTKAASAQAPTAPITREFSPIPPPSEEPQDEKAPPPPPSFEPSAGRAEPAQPRRWLLPLIGTALAIGAIVVFAILVLGGGSGGSKASGGSQTGAGGKGQASSSGSAGGPGAATGSATTPDGAVQSFYESAASGDYRGAWDLADASLRSQLGGYAAFQAQQSTLRSIEFPSMDVTSESGSNATVSFSTVATHTSFVDRCNGSMTLVKSGDGWVLDQAQDISCDRSSG